MSASPHLVAADTVMAVVDGGESLTVALADGADADAAKNSRAWLREVCYGGCRHYHYFDALLAVLLKTPLKKRDRVVHFILINACYQLVFMRAPDYAVVNEAVAAVSNTRVAFAGKLINAVLRKFLQQHEQLENELADDAARLSHPTWLYEKIRDDWPQHYKTILHAGNQKPPLTLRVNRQKTNRDDYLKKLAAVGIDATATVDADHGVTLKKPLPVTDIPGFTDGVVSVQDESAQLATVSVAAGARVLDACAAPGGKTGALLEAQPKVKLIALDLPDRIHAVKQNLSRLKLNATVVAGDLNCAGEWWDGAAFDCIVLDAPCSGSGIIRRHPDIKHRRRATDTAAFAAQQLRLLSSAWRLLAAAGELVYITCSIFSDENDAVIKLFLQAHADARVKKLTARGGVATDHGRQRLPGVHHGDGFYHCRLTRAGDTIGG